MDREEILKKSREQKEDEGVIYAENKGRRFGVIGFSCVFCVIVLFNLFTGHDNSAPFSMFWAFGSAEAYGKYIITKKKSFMTTTVLAAFASLCFLATYILKTMVIK